MDEGRKRVLLIRCVDFGSAVFRTATRTGAAENTDSPHSSHSKFRVGERKDVHVWLVEKFFQFDSDVGCSIIRWGSQG
jgi:hypothetical protein